MEIIQEQHEMKLDVGAHLWCCATNPNIRMNTQKRRSQIVRLRQYEYVLHDGSF